MMGVRKHIDFRSYRLNDHLGSVRVVISDAKQLNNQGDINLIDAGDSFSPSVLSFSDTYAFGSLMPGRNFSSSDYRYGGAGGQEADDEITSSRSHYTAKYWQYDSRIGRRWNVDPARRWLAPYSPYSTMGNNPVVYTDEDGDFVWNLIIGAITGGIVDMAFQVGEQMLSGQNFGSAIEKVDWEQVGWSTLEGAGDALWSSPAGMLGKMAKKLNKYPKLRALMGQIGDIVYDMAKQALKEYDKNGLDGLTGEWFEETFQNSLIKAGLGGILKKTDIKTPSEGQVNAANKLTQNAAKKVQNSGATDANLARLYKLSNSSTALTTSKNVKTLVNKVKNKSVKKVATESNKTRRRPGPVPSF